MYFLLSCETEKGGKKKKKKKGVKQKDKCEGNRNKSRELCAVHRKTDFKQTQIQIYFIYLNIMNIYFVTSELPKYISELSLSLFFPLGL